MEIDHIKRATEGDRSSFAFLVEKYKDLAFSVALRICKNSSDAEDIVQEAFIRIFSNLHMFRNESKFSTWLYRIVYNESIQYMRKYGKVAMQENVNFATASSSNETSDDMEKADRKAMVNLILNSMPGNYGLILTLFYINEKDINEIREITGFSVSNIKVLLMRARLMFRGKIDVMMKDELSRLNRISGIA